MSQNSAEISRWFAAEVQPHEPALRAWLHGQFPTVHDVDDLVQEAFTRVLRARERGEVRTPRALLFTAARNVALDQVRRQKIVSFEAITETDSLPVYHEAPDAATTAAHRQELELLTQAIQSLPDRCRQVLTLRKIYGLSQREIAEQLGISEHTVEVQVANGMRRCTQFLARHGLP